MKSWRWSASASPGCTDDWLVPTTRRGIPAPKRIVGSVVLIGSGAQGAHAGADSCYVAIHIAERMAPDEGSRTAAAARPAVAWVGDRGAILISSLLKFVVIVAIVGTVGFDAISMTTTAVQLGSAAQEAAQVGHDSYASSHSSLSADQQVALYAKQHGFTVPARGVIIAADGTVTVTLAAKAKTIAAKYISPLHKYVEPTATATATNSTY